MKTKNFPKIKSPFVRKKIMGAYVCTPEIEPGYEWVFEDPGVRAVDKLHGTNVCVIIQNGVVKAIDNRENRIIEDPKLDLAHMTGFTAMALQGIFNNLKNIKGRTGYVYGELIGPKINGNLHEVDQYMFVPFDYLKEKCHWKSWIRGDYPKTFEAIREWFIDLPSLYTKKVTGLDRSAEGLVFHHPDGRMAKLRRSMFDWYLDD